MEDSAVVGTRGKPGQGKGKGQGKLRNVLHLPIFLVNSNFNLTHALYLYMFNVCGFLLGTNASSIISIDYRLAIE